MSYYNFDLRPLFILPAIAVLLFWGIWEVVDYFFIEETIVSKTLIVPQVDVNCVNNICDTTYTYKKP